MGHVRSKSRSLGQFLEKDVYTLEGKLLFYLYKTLSKFSILMKSSQELKICHAGEKLGHYVKQ